MTVQDLSKIDGIAAVAALPRNDNWWRWGYQGLRINLDTTFPVILFPSS